MSKRKSLEQIYSIVRELYGDCVAVKIVVNCEGLEVNAVEKPFTKGCSMRTINGEWLERKEEK